MLDVDDAERLTGEEEFELLSAPLGLSERRPVPEAVHFPDTDPLGASVAMVTATNSMEETLLQIGTIITAPMRLSDLEWFRVIDLWCKNVYFTDMSVFCENVCIYVLCYLSGYAQVKHGLSIGCQSSVDKSISGRLSLGEQAAGLQTSADRLVALKRVTAAAQVLLARTMVMRALSLLSVRLVMMWLFLIAIYCTFVTF